MIFRKKNTKIITTNFNLQKAVLKLNRNTEEKKPKHRIYSCVNVWLLLQKKKEGNRRKNEKHSKRSNRL